MPHPEPDGNGQVGMDVPIMCGIQHTIRVDSHQRVMYTQQSTHLPEGLKLFQVDAVVAIGVNGPEDA